MPRVLLRRFTSCRITPGRTNLPREGAPSVIRKMVSAPLLLFFAALDPLMTLKACSMASKMLVCMSALTFLSIQL